MTDVASQVVPGIEDQPRVQHTATVVPSDTQQGASLCVSNQPHQRHRSFEQARVLGSPAVADRKLASVSAFEHPDLTFAGRGLLDRFPDLVAP